MAQEKQIRSNREIFLNGIKDGLPIGLGYLSVSFTFGIMAISNGLLWWQALLISMTCVTSAGQLAGINVMMVPGNYIEMFISQLTINMRYSFMSISLAQKTEEKFKGIYRWLLGSFVTDEIYAVAVSKSVVKRIYFLGLAILPYIGWAGGTLCGVLLGNVLPQMAMNALGIGLYAMFIAIVVPDMKGNKAIITVVVIAIILSCIFRYVPVINKVPGGIAISICAVAAALICAYVFPVEDEDAAKKETAVEDEMPV